VRKLTILAIITTATLLICSSLPAHAENPAAATESGYTVPTLSGPFNWVTEGPLIEAKGNRPHPINAIKDPSVVRYNGLWHLFASSVTKSGDYSMVYMNFADWKDAGSARQYYLNDNPNLVGYHCAPQIFYFTPQKLWYLITTSQQPTYSTTSDISKPETWTRPKNFFTGQPKSVVEGWLDYFIICDDTHAYLFFCDDHGRFFRSRTSMADFPKGFDEPVVAMQDKVAKELFEGPCVYHIKGTRQYLALIEAGNDSWKRYYKAFIADRLDGDWRPLAAKFGNSFADTTHVRMKDGSSLWTQDISHGEALRDGYDQSLTIDPANLALLYQGVDVKDPPATGYNEIRWQLGLLRRSK
jgi:hypothetical protein